MSLEVVCWGTRGSIPAPGRETSHYGGNTACVQIVTGDRLLILDAGTGLRDLGRHLSRSREVIRADLLLTHFHMDHIQGLPFFEPLYHPDASLDIHGSASSAEQLEKFLMRPMGTIYLPIPRSAVAARLKFVPFQEAPWSIGEATIACYPARHPEGAVGFKVQEGGRSVAYFPDNELVGGSHGEDEGWYAGLVEFLDGVDLLLHDAAFTDIEYRSREGWGHSTFHQAIRLSEDAGVHRLHLFHHAPERTDSQLANILQELREELARSGSRLELDAAREGAEVVISG